jgi:heme-degrading monooxygenase HmoA
MYASIHRFTGVQDTTADVLRVTRQLAAALSRRSGFVSYAMVEADHHVGISVTVFETHAGLVEANQFAAAWAAEHLAGWSADPPHITTGEVVVQYGM